MPDFPLQFTIRVREEIEGIHRTLEGMAGLNRQLLDSQEKFRQARTEAGSFASMFKTGLAIDIARRALDGLTTSVTGSLETLDRLSDQIEQAHLRARLGAEGYQVLGFHLRQAGGDASELVGALEFMRRTLGEASAVGSQQAKDLAELGLTYRGLAALPVEEKFERISRALMAVTDENRRAALTASLLGRSSAGLNDLIEALATRGLKSLTEEAAKSAGVLSKETAAALDDAGDRATAANEKFSKLFAGAAVSAARGKATFAELRTAVGQAVADTGGNWGQIAIATAGLTTVLIAAGPVLQGVRAATAAASAGSLGMKLAVGAAEAQIAGSQLASSFAGGLKAALSSTWVAGGALIAVALLAGLAINRAGASAVEARGQQTASENSEDTTRGGLASQLAGARDQATVDRVSTRATVLARSYGRAAAGQEDEGERTRLETLAKQYSLIVAQAREKGAAIIAANQATDAQKAATTAAEKQLAAAQTLSAELAKQAKSYQESAEKARYALADEQDKLSLLDQQLDRADADLAKESAAAELAKDAVALSAAQAKYDATVLSIANERETVEKRIADAKKAAAKADEEAAKARERAELDRQRKSAEAGRNKMEDRQDATQGTLASLDADFRRTDAEKWNERRTALQASLTAAREYLQAMKDLRALATTPEAQAQGDANVRAAGKDVAAADRDLAALGPDPNSFSDQAIAGITRLREEWNLTAKSMAESMTATLSSAQGATSNFLFDGLSGAKSWSDAWDAATLQVGQQFLRMITDQVSKLLWKSTVERSLNALGLASHVGTETAKTTATATGTASRLGMIIKEALASVYKGAVQAFESLSSIPYVGPFLGAAAMAAAVAGGIALVGKIAGHADGGYHEGAGWVSGPGTATSDSINARLSNGEWVAPVWQTKHPVYGPMIAALEAGRRGQVPGYSLGGFLRESLSFGGPKAGIFDKRVRGLMEDYNLFTGRKIYGYSTPADGDDVFLSASASEAATPAAGSGGSFSQTDLERMVRLESARNIHLHLSERGWKEAIRDDVTSIAREIYWQEQRNG